MGAAAFTILAGTLVGLFLLFRVGRRDHNLPPGPPTLPILGNLLTFPTSNAHLQFATWAHQYGGIYSLKLAHGTAIVLSSRRLIRDLLDKKGANFNDRPPLHVATHYIAQDELFFPFLPHGETWKRCRKLIVQYFSEVRVEREHMTLIEAESTQMLFDFAKEPGALMMHPKRFSNSVIMGLVYGTRTVSADAAHLKMHWETVERFGTLLEPGAIPPVDLLPWLKYVPETMWFGQWRGWKSRADEAGKIIKGMLEDLTKPVLERREKGVDVGSFCDYLFEKEGGGETFSKRDLIRLAGTMIDAGSDTTGSTILNCIQAMAKYPEYQERAHTLIDELVGASRTPNWTDHSNLPYVSQIIKEAMRWRPVGALIAHATTNAEQIENYRIPAGTIVFANIWGLNHAPSSLDPPNTPLSDFDPDRYVYRTAFSSYYAVSPDFESRDHYGYGVGRRTCPGIHLAERTLFIAVAKLLWAFEFREKPGNPIDVDPVTGYIDGIVRDPRPFECEVFIRPGREEVIEREFAAARSILAKFEL